MKPKVTKYYRKLTVESSKQRVLEVFLRNPDKEFSLSDLAKEAGVAKAHIGSILDWYNKTSMVEITKLSKIWRIKANQRSLNFIGSKIIYNLNFIYQSGLVEYLNEYFRNPKAIILFGSLRKGEDISTSDIDIAIESEEAKEYRTITLPELSGFEKEINRKIQIHLFNQKNVDLNVFNNIANGIVVFGFLEVKPA